MPEWLQQTVQVSADLSLWTLLARLSLAFVLGVIVAGIYRWTHRRDDVPANTFLTTLVLMTIVIAMSTQVIGDNVARAFSLVGALSIVRFRTVVQDTRDTVYVIFAVVVGMAVGAGHLDVALIGITITGIASFLVRPRTLQQAGSHGLQLLVRVGLGHDADELVQQTFATYLEAHTLHATASAKQGSAIDFTYNIQLRSDITPVALVRDLSLKPGVQNVEIKQLSTYGRAS